MNHRMLLFDLDGTLLRSDKTISPRTQEALQRCRSLGILIGVATSRGEQNAMGFLKQIQPDGIITSAGALVRCQGQIINNNGFTAEETSHVLKTLQAVCGSQVFMTVDTVDDYYRNYEVPATDADQTWAMGHMTDYAGFSMPSLKICFECHVASIADAVAAALPHCDLIHFSDGPWYKLTPKNATKETAILQMCDALGLQPAQIAAFGDDYADMGMLRLCGTGIAMGNAIPEVKAIANLVTGSNDEDGIACWIEHMLG
ncbi:MAG: HAD family phosphatase [Clostridiales bacterium]|nr:HAD family phosphatase [Clostridiales bacterium]